MDFNPSIPDPNKKKAEIVKAELVDINNSRKELPEQRISQDRFFGIIKSEQKNIRKCDKVLGILIEDLFNPENMMEYSTKDKIDLYKAVTKNKSSSRDFILRLYEAATRNEYLKQYLETKTKKNPDDLNLDDPEEVKQIIFNIREKMNKKSREISDGTEPTE